MAEYFLGKLLDGVGNGLDVPESWGKGEEHEYRLPGTDQVGVYEQRQYFEASDVYYVWVNKETPAGAFFSVMFWHRELYRGSLVETQKDLLHHSMSAAQSYTNVVMVVGYAALFTLWSQTKADFTVGTSLAAGVFLALSVLAFVGWEIFGMVIRSKSNIAVAKAVADPFQFELRMKMYRDNQSTFMRKFVPVWTAVMSFAVATALAAFAILLSGLLHGVWLAFVADSIARVSG